MNKFLLTVGLCLIAAATYAQSFSYQATARDASGDLLVNETIGVRIQLRNGAATGTVEYSEEFTATTNDNGVFALAIGEGATSSPMMLGDLSWGVDTYFLEVAIDEMGGTSYMTVGASEIRTVPVAITSERFETQVGNTDVIQLAQTQQAISNNVAIALNNDSNQESRILVLENQNLDGRLTIVEDRTTNAIIGNQALSDRIDTIQQNVAADMDQDATNELVTDFSLNGSVVRLEEAGVVRTVDLDAEFATQAELDAVQLDVDNNETAANAAIAAVQSDVDTNEADADAAIAAAAQASVDADALQNTAIIAAQDAADDAQADATQALADAAAAQADADAAQQSADDATITNVNLNNSVLEITEGTGTNATTSSVDLNNSFATDGELANARLDLTLNAASFDESTQTLEIVQGTGALPNGVTVSVADISDVATDTEATLDSNDPTEANQVAQISNGLGSTDVDLNLFITNDEQTAAISDGFDSVTGDVTFDTTGAAPVANISTGAVTADDIATGALTAADAAADLATQVEIDDNYNDSSLQNEVVNFSRVDGSTDTLDLSVFAIDTDLDDVIETITYNSIGDMGGRLEVTTEGGTTSNVLLEALTSDVENADNFDGASLSGQNLVFSNETDADDTVDLEVFATEGEVADALIVNTMDDVIVTGDIDGGFDVQLAPDVVTTDEILDGTILTTDIGAGEVTQNNIATGAVGSDEIIDGQVGTLELANGSVTTDKIAASAVTTDEILDGTILTEDLDITEIVDGQDGNTTGLATDAELALAAAAADVSDVQVNVGGTEIAVTQGGVVESYTLTNDLATQAELDVVEDNSLVTGALTGDDLVLTNGAGTATTLAFASDAENADNLNSAVLNGQAIDLTNEGGTAVASIDLSGFATETEAEDIAEAELVSTTGDISFTDNAGTIDAQIDADAVGSPEIATDAVGLDELDDTVNASQSELDAVEDNSVVDIVEVTDGLSFALGDGTTITPLAGVTTDSEIDDALVGDLGDVTVGGGIATAYTVEIDAEVITATELADASVVGGAGGDIQDNSIDENDIVSTPGLVAELNNAGLATDAEVAASISSAFTDATGDVTFTTSGAGMFASSIEDDAVTAADLNMDTAGEGLVQNASGALDVNPGAGLEIAMDAVAITDDATNGVTVGTSGVTVNAGNGIELDGDDVAADIDTAAGLEFNGTNEISLNVDTANDFQFTAGELSLADDSIDNDEIADDAVDTDQIADDAVEAAQIATDAVTNDAIADDAVNASNLDADVAGAGLVQNAASGAIDAVGNSGITVAADDISATIDTTAGIEFTGTTAGDEAIAVNVDTAAGLDFSAAGAVEVVLDATETVADLQFVSGGIAISPDAIQTGEIDDDTVETDDLNIANIQASQNDTATTASVFNADPSATTDNVLATDLDNLRSTLYAGTEFVAASTTVANLSRYVVVTGGTGNTITLPTGDSNFPIQQGRIVTVSNNSANPVDVANVANIFTIPANAAATFIHDGSNWIRIEN